MFLGPQSKILLAVFFAGVLIVSSTTYAQKEEARYVVVDVDCKDDEDAKAILDHASIDAKKDRRSLCASPQPQSSPLRLTVTSGTIETAAAYFGNSAGLNCLYVLSQLRNTRQ